MKRTVSAAFVLAFTVQSHAIEAFRAQDIAPYKAPEMRPHRSDIQPYRAQEVKPAPTAPVAPAVPQTRPEVTVPKAADARPAAVPAREEKPAQPQKAEAKALTGVWQTNIPGAVYTTPSGLAGYDILHVASGTAAGLLSINTDGTYSWNSYGGKKGKWVATADAEYPLEIIDTVEKRRWRVGYNQAKRTLFIWDGSIWYEGRRAEVRGK